MITVRFPNGQAVQYNDATYAFPGRPADGFTDLFTKKGGTIIAQVPNTCIIEFTAPCHVYNPLMDELKKLARGIRRAQKK